MSSERQDRAYQISARAYRQRLDRRRPKDARLLESTRAAELVEVRGDYDHVGSVLRASGLPFVSVSPDRLHELDWESAQVMWVNCPGRLDDEAIRKVAKWVREGGHLATTDWALKYLLEPAFPGKVRHNGLSIPDCVVKVEPLGESPLLGGFDDDGRDALWWMERASHPCEVLDPSVRVLVRSGEVAARHGAAPIVVEWDEGEGKVLHLVSHLYLQRSETRSKRDGDSASTYLKEFGLDAAEAEPLLMMADDLKAGELKSAGTTAAFATEHLLRKKRGLGGARSTPPAT